MASESAIPSHKRTISSSTLEAEPPKSKPRTEYTTVADSLPEYVYVVILDMNPAYGDSTSEVRGVFCAIGDANNCLKGIVADEFTSAESCTKGTRQDGRVFWKSADIGEGDTAEISVEKQTLYAPGSYIARDWPTEMEWDENSVGAGGNQEEEDEEDEGEEDEEEGEEEGANEDDEEDDEEEGAEGEEGEEEDDEEDEDEK